MKPRKPIKRSRKPIAQMSARRLGEQERRAEVVAEVHARDRVCQGGSAHALVGVRCNGRLEVNEIVPRSGWAKGYLDPANCVLLCHDFHAWVTSHPNGAHALGFRRWSWERDAAARS